MSVEKEDLEEIKVNNLSLRVFSSFFLILLISCLFLNDNFFFPIIIHSLVSLSIWEFLRLLNYRNSDRISSDKGNFFSFKTTFKLFRLSSYHFDQLIYFFNDI